MVVFFHPTGRMWRRALRALALAALALAAGRAGAGTVALSPVDAAGKWSAGMRQCAADGLGRAEARLGLTLDRPAEIISFPSSFEFEAYLGAAMPRIVAAARPQRCQIAIDRRAWFAQAPAQQAEIMTHEMTHLILGRRIKGRLPAWLDEGLAMMVAGQQDFDSHWRVLVAGTFDTLIPLQMLMDRVTIGEGRLDQAYAQSLSLTRFYLHQQFPLQARDDPAPLVQRLADPESGPKRVRLLWDPVLVASLEYQWRHSWYVIWAMMIFLTGSTFLWMGISLLFLVAWWRKRCRARAMRERFAAEENWDAEFGGLPPPWHEEPALDEDPGDERRD